jgi:hypothetical protein
LSHTENKSVGDFLLFTQHLDYLSCLLTISSTVLVGRRRWQGWVVAGVNSLIISLIGLKTSQWGFVPANLFCLVIYLYNIRRWRRGDAELQSTEELRF